MTNVDIYEQLDLDSLDDETIKVIIDECSEFLKGCSIYTHAVDDEELDQTIQFLIKIGTWIPEEREIELLSYLWNGAAVCDKAAFQLHKYVARKFLNMLSKTDVGKQLDAINSAFPQSRGK